MLISTLLVKAGRRGESRPAPATRRENEMPSLEGEFVWHELATTDPDAAGAFYREVVGWRTRDAGVPGMRYTVLSAGEAGVGGIAPVPADACAAGPRPGWIGYVGVGDVDACAERVGRAGGTVHKPAGDIPGVGRFAVVADPQGAAFVLFKGSSERPPERPALGTPGTTGWNELHAGEGESAFAFYADLFGWREAEAFDMGPAGTYRIFAAGDGPIGGVMTRREAEPAPFWLHYFTVDAIDAASARVTGAGGRVLEGPHPVPGGSWILHCRDPQGAMFALVAPRR
jgi:predicted enzyme related to lactoylglutathione lyase